MSTQSEDGREVEPSPAGRDDQGNHSSSSEQVEFPVDPYSVIHLIQCPRCSQPLRVPLRLPCGNTLCRSCLPPLSKRVGVSHPLEAGREEGFTCPWKGKGCGNIDDGGLLTEHSMSDCGVDVVVSKVLDAFEKVLGDSVGHDMPPLQIRWTLAIENEKETDNSSTPQVGKAIIQHGRYLGTYKLMKEGGLRYDIKDVVYEDVEPSGGLSESIRHDEAVLKQLKEAVRNELDCQVCYGLMIDPLTSSCGHTFCQKCLARVLDHSSLCPVCRRKLSIPPGPPSEPVNRILAGLIDSLYPDEIHARREAAKSENSHGDNELLPLFVCTLSFPSMPTFLHVFEPRYRLMIRRALDSGRKFGMVAFNRNGQPQGELGMTQFMQYGTVLRIDRIEFFPDGRSLLTAIGSTRFKVVDWGILDGYHVARTERIDDISLAEEESLEAREMAAAASNTPSSEGNGESSEMPLEALSTQQLLQLCLDFVEKRRAEGAPWLRQQALAAYGEPPTDPARFPYWFASVLPIAEEEKYALLPTTSMRERLKITARWVRKLENMEW
ncbi:ATP-dependent protease (CrgA) [Rasamsonia emersonii CBS 393.64]|uniref:ATP-dependent protease (CrgA) n=1 Tax=Rasamsonia emersonii (strain ATCC 16479 / CBS 393.64 / IMI 116815) TaxID=1408163 RepID=A0A0F4Z489_RASE3|nr:ATP-dependent protease (CrgA) [Rasamsonia emersonii CBS 393.64]KKA25349.1 ATP-dependent protease (CrgA) [Rasamsonia emersonii CBS 393.64]